MDTERRVSLCGGGEGERGEEGGERREGRGERGEERGERHTASFMLAPHDQLAV